jgi:RHS repeat-associated protein
LGLVTTYTWNNLQQLTSTSFPDDTYISNIYQNLDMVETIDRLGLSAKYQYDPLRHLVAATNALGNVTRYDYCACGALESMQDSLGNYTHYYYDIAGRLTNTTYPDGMFWIKHYNALGQVTNMVDEAEVSHTNWFNNQGLLYASSNAFGQVYDRSFDIEDRLTNQVDANGVSVSMTYDNLGRMLTRSYPDAGVERFGYSPAGLIAYTNQLTNRTYYAYDAARRKTAETNANNNMTFYGYDAASDLISLTDQKNSVTQWGYDLYGRVTNKVDATSTTILKYGYDADNRLTNRWSAEKGNTAYGYDNVGNLTGVTYPVSPALSFSYNAMNWMTGMSDGIGATTFTYTPAGQLASETGPWANDTVAYTYYDRLRTGLNLQQPSASAWVQSYDYDAANRLHSITSPAGTFDYHYSPGVDGTTASSGLVAQINLPNTAIITNTYDNNARMLSTSLKNSGGVDLDSYAYTYNVGNQRTAVNRTSENTANYTYDPIGQVISDTAAEGTTNRLNEQLHYGYDPSGNLAARTNNALVQDFSVNSLNELTSNTNSGTLTVVGTTTSQATNVTVNGTAAAHYGDATFAASGLGLTTTYTAVAQDSFGRTASNTVTVNLSPAVTFQYDANGNLTNDGLRSFAYDDENQLIQVWVNNRWMSQFQYDARLRRRIRQEYTWTGSSWNKTNEVHYVYDRRLLIQERDVNNLPIATYVRGEDLSKSFEGMGGIGGLLARTSQQFATDPLVGYSYYHCDGNGSVTMLINESQVVVAKYIYDAFGNLLSESGLLAHNNPFGFSSKEIDRHSGLVYYFYRYYDPNLQRWLNKDPISEQGGINLYEFALNSPEIIVDKNGKKPVFNDPTKGGFPGEGQPISDPGNKPTTDPTAPPQGNLGGPGSPGASGLAGLPGLLNPEHGDDDTAGWTPIQSAMQCWKQSGHTDPFAPPAVFGAGGTPPPTSSAGPMQPLPPLPSVPSFPPFQPPPPTLSQGGPSAPPGMGCSICPVNNPVSF